MAISKLLIESIYCSYLLSYADELPPILQSMHSEGFMVVVTLGGTISPKNPKKQEVF